jgi:hypothetical protein
MLTLPDTTLYQATSDVQTDIQVPVGAEVAKLICRGCDTSYRFGRAAAAAVVSVSDDPLAADTTLVNGEIEWVNIVPGYEFLSHKSAAGTNGMLLVVWYRRGSAHR